MRTAGIAVGAVALWLLHVITGGRLGNEILLLIYSNWLWFLVAVVVALGALALASLGFEGSAVILGIVGVIGLIALPMFSNYQADLARYAHVEVSKAPSLTYLERAAFPVAEAQVTTAVTVTGQVDPTTYIGGKDFTTLVKLKGGWASYGQVVVQSISLTGQASSRTCAFSPRANLAMDNVGINDLEAEIIWRKPGVMIDPSDAYAYCDGERPVVVVPLKYLVGTWPSMIEASAGVAVYDGITGQLEVREHVKAGEIPGPVYPMSLSRQAYDSTKSMGSFPQWLFDAIGFSDTASDAGDPNAENVGDFHLVRADGSGSDFVTPLTKQGVSTAISGIGAVAANEASAGKVNKYVIHELPKVRPSNSSLAVRIKDTFGTDVPWQNGSRIFEISPVSQEEWVGSIGLKQSVSFRVRAFLDGRLCLEGPGGAQIKCVGADGVVEQPPAPPAPPAEPQKTTGLGKMSKSELLSLWDALRREIEKRMG